MNKSNIYFTILLMIVIFVTCGNSPKEKTQDTDSMTKTCDTVVQKDTVIDLPEWVNIDTTYIEGCVTITSKNIKLNLDTCFNVFPFVVIDRKTKEREMFFLVSLKRQDMLYINQFGMIDENNRPASAVFVERVSLTDNSESIVFIMDSIQCKEITKYGNTCTFLAWGLLGSVSKQLSEEQTENLIELVKLVE